MVALEWGPVSAININGGGWSVTDEEEGDIDGDRGEAH